MPEQLESLVLQTRRPDELIVGDDGSTDGTLKLLQDFADRSPFPVSILRVEGRLGPAANLQVVLTAARGDVLFPCDQDDIWLPSKIARLLRALGEHPAIPAAFCDSTLIDADGHALPGSLWSTHGFSRAAGAHVLSGRGAVDIAVRNVVASHALALRRSALSLIVPFAPVRNADWWTALLLAGSDGMVPISDCLVDYRQHGANAVGAHTAGDYSRRLSGAPGRLTDRVLMIRAAIDRLHERRPGALSDDDVRDLLAYVRHLETRGSLPRNRPRRVSPVLAEFAAGRYRRYGHAWKRAVLDVVRPGGADR